MICSPLRSLFFACALLLGSAAHAADFQWLDANGNSHALEELKGQAVVLHIWASWCFPCRSEMPAMTAWLRKNPDIRVLPISLDESADDARRFMQKIGLHVPLLQTTPSQLYALGSRGLPTTVVVNKHGDIVSVHPGIESWDEAMHRRLQPLFAGNAS